MTVKDIADIIIRNKYIAFQVGILNSLKERQVVEEVIIKHSSIESYLYKIAELYGVTNLTVIVFSDGGTSRGKKKYRNEQEYQVEIKDIGGNEIDTPKNNRGNEIDTPLMNGGNDINTPLLPQSEKARNTTENPQKHTTMQDQDFVKMQVLEIKHEMLKNQYDQSMAKVSKLEKKVDDLHEENKKLLRDNLTKEDKHELALERVKLEHEKHASEQKESLSGVIGDAIKDPDMLKMIVGFINPKHPMFEKEPQAQLTGADDANREIQYTQNNDVNRILNDIPRVLSQKDGDTLTKVYLLFQKFVTSPEVLNQAAKQFVPELTN